MTQAEIAVAVKEAEVHAPILGPAKVQKRVDHIYLALVAQPDKVDHPQLGRLVQRKGDQGGKGKPPHHQCRKWRWPVKTIARPSASAASITA
jgi:hypothetical protein